LIQRDDDQEATIRKRLDVYNQQTLSLVNYYRQAGLLISIDGMQDINEVQKQILTAIQEK